MKKTNANTKLFDLFWTFFKIGAFTFGGGFAMLSLIEEEIVNKKHWATSEDMMDMIIIAESTPGVLAVNTATACGFRTRGVLGSIVATLGVVLPSFLITFGLSFAIAAFESNFWYKAAFSGIQICVCVLIFNAFVKVAKNISKDIFNYIALVAAFFVALLTDFNVIFLIAIGAVLGIAITLVKDKLNKDQTAPLADALNNKEDKD